MNPQTAEARYQLTIANYPNDLCILRVCELLYQNQDKNLLASLSSLPYIVGRSFSASEADQYHTQLKQLHVSHRFNSDLDGTPLYSFDTTEKNFDTNKAPDQKKTRVISLNIRKESRLLLWLISCLSLGGVVFLFWQQKQESKADLKSETFEARIEQIEKDVEFKSADEIIWKKASLQAPLQSRDSLRTFQDSTALLVYREGTRLTVQPNSLMIIGKTPSADINKIELENGGLKARMRPAKDLHRFTIQTKSGTLELESPKTDGLETKVETSIDKGTLTVAVTQGAATLIPNSKDAQPVALKSREQVTATTEAVSKTMPYEPSILLTSPSQDAAIQLDPQKASTTVFRWRGIGEAADYELLLASDSEMKEVLLKEKTQKTEIELSYIDLGTVYWQVVANADGISYKSPVWRIHVEKPSE